MTHLDEAFDGLRNVLRELRAGDRLRRAAEVAGGDLTAPWCIPGPLYKDVKQNWIDTSCEWLTIRRIETDGPRCSNIASSRPNKPENRELNASVQRMPHASPLRAKNIIGASSSTSST